MSEVAVGVPTKVLRAGSASKRAAILRAARELFIAEGLERTSVDAVAARAEVSKRTIYDYFGDKRTLFVAVVEEAIEQLLARVRAAVDADLLEVDDLEEALVSFSHRIALDTVGSSDYVTLRRLATLEAERVSEVRDRWLSGAPEEALAERFTELARAGLLHVPDARLAADHFVALALAPMADDNGLSARPVDLEYRVREGVRAFLRAYAPSPVTTSGAPAGHSR